MLAKVITLFYSMENVINIDTQCAFKLAFPHYTKMHANDHWIIKIKQHSIDKQIKAEKILCMLP